MNAVGKMLAVALAVVGAIIQDGSLMTTGWAAAAFFSSEQHREGS